MIGIVIGCLFAACGWSGGGEAREGMVLMTYRLAIPCGAMLEMVMHPETDHWLAFVLIAWTLEGLLFGVLFGLDGREQA